jgi:hypothetical protein
MATIAKQKRADVLGITTYSTRRQFGKHIPWLLHPFGSQYRSRSYLAMSLYDIENYNYWFDTLWGGKDITVALGKLIPSTEAELPSVEELCQDYLSMVNTFEIVKQILIVEDEEGFTIWTIIEAEPFDDSQRKPIYQAQINMLRQMKEDIPIDFHILNASECSNLEDLRDVIPSNAKIFWQR